MNLAQRSSGKGIFINCVSEDLRSPYHFFDCGDGVFGNRPCNLSHCALPIRRWYFESPLLEECLTVQEDEAKAEWGLTAVRIKYREIYTFFALEYLSCNSYSSSLDSDAASSSRWLSSSEEISDSTRSLWIRLLRTLWPFLSLCSFASSSWIRIVCN